MDKVALVTGGSSGIGYEISKRLSEEGYRVVVNYRTDTEALDTFLNEINGVGMKADVSNMTQVEEMFTRITEKYGRLDVLVNNAGITKDTLLLRMKEEDFNQVLDINLKGTFCCTKFASNLMLKQKHGRIINLSSVIGEIGNAGQSNYAASKAGIIGFTKSVAKELATRGITVNAIAPGFIQTKMTEVLDEKTRQTILAGIPLGRFGNVEDVANLVLFLASDKANYITGQVINVDGGMVM